MSYNHPANCDHCKAIEDARNAARAELIPKVVPDLKEAADADSRRGR